MNFIRKWYRDSKMKRYQKLFGFPDKTGLLFDGVIVTTQKIYKEYYWHLEPQQRFQDYDLSQMGFVGILFFGIPVVYHNPFPDRLPTFKVSKQEFKDAVLNSAENIRKWLGK